ncbi:Helix-turn-helix domain protein [Rubripirellula amarantea]|uniref:Helix-turn-helix domain protein n=1 Tax=Rubripirellula amarantea TaxID=2527999 RepID=A0A5C5WB45_9BACT|nr:helix-turn-helix domain-containing protein [Rubripirellula amarantea]TWT48078.1 Helix-turn-helix domain protein [Rubripirellula amarantea]
MAARQPQYSPKQVAEALGASESSLKRWCDRGAIATIRTVGGHRRITLDGLRDFLETSGRELLAPQVLGLPKLGVGRSSEISGSDDPDQRAFRKAIVNGDEEACRKVLQHRLDQGMLRSEAAEFFIADAMHEVGAAWQCNSVDVYQERRGCEICIRLISELRAGLPPLRDDAPIAIGGTPTGDIYQLPTALVELALREVGWNAVNLGCNLPWDSFVQASHDYQPEMMWLSVSHIDDAPSFVIEQNRLADSLGENVTMLIGGQALTDQIRPRLRYTAFCDSIGHLTELAAMMRLK